RGPDSATDRVGERKRDERYERDRVEGENGAVRIGEPGNVAGQIPGEDRPRSPIPLDHSPPEGEEGDRPTPPKNRISDGEDRRRAGIAPAEFLGCRALHGLPSERRGPELHEPAERVRHVRVLGG